MKRYRISYMDFEPLKRGERAKIVVVGEVEASTALKALDTLLRERLADSADELEFRPHGRKRMIVGSPGSIGGITFEAHLLS